MSALAWAWLLAAARLWALLRVQPSWRAVLGRRWEWIAAVLAGALAVAPATSSLSRASLLPADAAMLPVLLLFELALGTVLGLAASLCGWALLGAAIESERGLGLGSAEADERPRSLALLLLAASLAAGLALGLHEVLLRGALGSFLRFDLGAPGRWQLVAGDVGEIAVLAFEACALALALASPVLMVRALVDVLLASLGRGPEPAAGMLAALLPGLRVVLALLVLGAAWSSYPEAFAAGL